MADVEPDRSARLDLTGTALSAAGLGLVVFGILQRRLANLPSAPSRLGLSPVIWLVIAGGLVLRGFLGWERRLAHGEAALIDPPCSRNAAAAV